MSLKLVVSESWFVLFVANYTPFFLCYGHNKRNTVNEIGSDSLHDSGRDIKRSIQYHDYKLSWGRRSLKLSIVVLSIAFLMHFLLVQLFSCFLHDSFCFLMSPKMALSEFNRLLPYTLSPRNKSLRVINVIKMCYQVLKNC